MGEGFRKMVFYLPRFWMRVRQFLLKHGKEYDVFHVCDFDTAVPALFIGKHPKIVYDIFDYYADSHIAPDWISAIIRKAENMVIRKSDVTIICSEARKKQIFPAKVKQLVVIHNSPSSQIQREDQQLNRDSQPMKCKLVFVGMLSEDRFLREIAEVIRNRNDIELHIGGMGVLGEYFQSLSQTTENIFFYGKLSYPKALDLENRCDIMTAIYDPKIPNHKYAAPNKFYEALMLKKPLIMLKNTGMDNYVSQYELGAVIDLEKVSFMEGFAEALDTLVQHRDYWGVMGERGHKLYQQDFSWNEMEKRLLEAYENL